MKTVGTLFLLAATTASVAAAVASATPPALPALDASLFAAAELQMCAAGCRLLGSPELVAFAAAVEAMPNEFANLHITREEGQEPQLVIFGPSGEVLYRRAVEHMSGAALEALLASFGFVRGGAAERRADASPGTGASTVLARHTALRAKALAAAAAADKTVDTCCRRCAARPGAACAR
jgi:hypothetical protein